MTRIPRHVLRSATTHRFDACAILCDSMPLASMAKSELLEDDASSKVQTCPSQAFLLGLATTWFRHFGLNLTERFRDQGVGAFDADFLVDPYNARLFDPVKSYNLFGTASSESQEVASSEGGPLKQYSGSTQFFFLACTLMRVALQSVVSTENEFYSVNRRAIEFLQNYAAQRGTLFSSEPSTHGLLSENNLKYLQPTAAAIVGLREATRDPELLVRSTEFALLQLQWVLSVAKSEGRTFVPDWMVKEPARWLSFVAHRKHEVLKPAHAQQAVESCTELLQIGTDSFPPVVVYCLIQVALAFVQAGVWQAKLREWRKKARRNRRGNADADEPPDLDDRCLDVYLTFDPRDLGVAVFTNALVCTRLCPSLVCTFKAFDLAQVDIDADHGFSKQSAKNDVADLL